MTTLRELGLEHLDQSHDLIDGGPCLDRTAYRYRVQIPKFLLASDLKFLTTILDVPALELAAGDTNPREKVVGVVSSAIPIEGNRLELEVRFGNIRYPDSAPRFLRFRFHTLPDRTPPDMLGGASSSPAVGWELADVTFAPPADVATQDAAILARAADLSEILLDLSRTIHGPKTRLELWRELGALVLVLAGRATLSGTVEEGFVS